MLRALFCWFCVFYFKPPDEAIRPLLCGFPFSLIVTATEIQFIDGCISGYYILFRVNFVVLAKEKNGLFTCCMKSIYNSFQCHFLSSWHFASIEFVFIENKALVCFFKETINVCWRYISIADTTEIYYLLCPFSELYCSSVFIVIIHCGIAHHPLSEKFLINSLTFFP